MNRNITGKVIINLVALVMLTAMGAQAETYNWTGTTGNWNELSNWDNGIPTATSADTTDIGNGGTAIIPTGYDSAVSYFLTLAYSPATSGHIVQNGGTLTIEGSFYVGRSGAGTYTLNDGLLDYNGGEFTVGRFGDANSGAASFYQKGGEVQAGNINMTRAGSLYEISGGTLTGGTWFAREDNTTIRVVGSAADINIAGLHALRNFDGGAFLEFVLDNSANHISTVKHTVSNLRRAGHLVAKLNGGVLLSGTNQFNLVQSVNTMALDEYSAWTGTPGDLWTYSGNVLDGGTYYERITLDANQGTLDTAIEKNHLDIANSTYGHIDLSNVGSTLDIGLEFASGFATSDLALFTSDLTAAGIDWTTGYGRYDIGLFLDPTVDLQLSTSGNGYFAWDFSDYNTLQLIGIANTIPEPSSLLMLGLAALAALRRRR